MAYKFVSKANARIESLVRGLESTCLNGKNDLLGYLLMQLSSPSSLTDHPPRHRSAWGAYLDVTFLENKASSLDAQALIFQNYYTSSFGVFAAASASSRTHSSSSNRRVITSAFLRVKSAGLLKIEDLGPVMCWEALVILFQPHDGLSNPPYRRKDPGCKQLHLFDKWTTECGKVTINIALQPEARFLSENKVVKESAKQETMHWLLVTWAQSDKAAKNKVKNDHREYPCCAAGLHGSARGA